MHPINAYVHYILHALWKRLRLFLKFSFEEKAHLEHNFFSLSEGVDPDNMAPVPPPPSQASKKAIYLKSRDVAA